MLENSQIDVLSSVPDVRASTTLSRPAQWLADWIGGDESDAGISMSIDKALSYAPVVQAISVLAGDVGQLPLDLYRRITDRDREKDREHPAFRLARRRANRYMSAATFRETMMLHVLLWGNAVAEIERDERGIPTALWPLLPDRTSKFLDPNGQLWYLTRVGTEGQTRELRLRPENVVHIANFGTDGGWGVSTIQHARNSWGLGLAGEKYANKFFANNGMPSGTLDVPYVLDDEPYERLRRRWRAAHEGLNNTARVAILEQGTKYTPIAFSQKDSQWLESRVHQKREVASWFNLPPHKLGDLEDANYSNMVEKNRDYLCTGLMRWLVKWQDEYDEKLLSLPEKQGDSHYFEFNTDALLRADIKTRYEAYSIALGGHPFREINEVRANENLNSLEGGDFLPRPLNISGAMEEEEEEESAGSLSQPVPNNRGKVLELLQCEANRVAHAARTAKNFLGWLKSFYSRWPATLQEALGETTSADEIQDWSSQHELECVELAGEAHGAEDLHARIQALTVAWFTRTEQHHHQLQETRYATDDNLGQKP